MLKMDNLKSDPINRVDPPEDHKARAWIWPRVDGKPYEYLVWDKDGKIYHCMHNIWHEGAYIESWDEVPTTEPNLDKWCELKYGAFWAEKAKMEIDASNITTWRGKKIRTKEDGSYYIEKEDGSYENPKSCPVCESTSFEVRNHSLMWHDGDIYCKNCGSFIRYFDAG